MYDICGPSQAALNVRGWLQTAWATMKSFVDRIRWPQRTGGQLLSPGREVWGTMTSLRDWHIQVLRGILKRKTCPLFQRFGVADYCCKLVTFNDSMDRGLFPRTYAWFWCKMERGHTSGHYVLVQSWFPMISDVAAREALPTPVVPHETQGRGDASRASEGDTCLLLEELMDAGAEVAETAVPSLAPRDCCGVVEEYTSWHQYVSEKIPDWQGRPDLLRLTVAALVVYKLRLREFTMREHVQLLWIFEGRTTLRSHGGTCYMYEKGAWVPFRRTHLRHHSCTRQAMDGRLGRLILCSTRRHTEERQRRAHGRTNAALYESSCG